MKRLLLAAALCITLSSKAATFPQLFTTNSFSDGYGIMATPTNILVLPTPFVIVASNWNPIVVSGAGTAGINGSYYQLSTNFAAGLPSAVWTNSSGADFRIVYNDAAIVPSSVASNYFTFENAAGNLLYYELVATVPFATWSVQINGVSPAPTVGTRFPSLISASRAASGGVLILNPGIYDIGYFTWFPTNLTVVSHGAKIIGFNAVDLVHPFGGFAMYGGSISNANLVGGAGGIAGTAFQITHITNFMTLHDVEIFGPSDGLFGNFNSDNLTLDILGGLYGGWWDTIVIGKAPGLTNVTGSIIGARFWNRTNFISTSSSFINATLNRVLISGCTMNMGIGFTSGSGVNVNDANTTNEINGCVINMQPGVAKVLQSAGTAIVDGQPYDVTDYVGTIKFSASLFNPTNYASQNPNFRVPVSIFNTNAAFAWAACTNVDTTKRYFQRAYTFVTNSAAGTIAMTMPANVFVVGSTTVTRWSQIEWQTWGGIRTNAIITSIN